MNEFIYNTLYIKRSLNLWQFGNKAIWINLFKKVGFYAMNFSAILSPTVYNEHKEVCSCSLVKLLHKWFKYLF